MGEPARILIVDDDESIREVLTSILTDEGYIVEAVDTGEKAVKATHEKFYNLALIDIRLPDMEGTKLLTKLKDTVPKMRKIIITGYPTLQNAIEAVNKGADAYIIKPIDMEETLKVIREQLQKQAEEKKYSEQKIVEFIETRVKELEAKERK
ncbi:MAG TPA: response regulator [Candidatus Bathyarchaeota archaeon]|nr:response regulator [Candidatus Bathyarchaeota archaeon]